MINLLNSQTFTMYNRCVGRVLFIVGRQLGQKICENTRNNVNGAILCAPNSTIKNIVFPRNYCDKSSEETVQDVEKRMSLDEESSIKLKDFLATPENERTFKIFELEVEVMRQNSEKVPDYLRPNHWYELLQLDTRSKRRRYLSFLWGLEKKKENQKAAKLEKRKMLDERLPWDGPFKLGGSTMFLRIYDCTMNHMWNSRLMNSILFGQPVVLDCSYDVHMNRMEMRNTARQVKLSFSANRLHDEPFNMYLCNTNNSGEFMRALHRFIPPLYDTDFPLNVKTESYLDVFDKDRLVYLTPHCQEVMTEFDYDAVYIIGAFVDKSSNEPVSLAKAKKEGLKMAKLPLDRYLHWGCSSGKNLTINAVMSILLDLRLTKSWVKALEHVPRRKLYQNQAAMAERRMKRACESEPAIDDPDKSMPLQEIRPKVGYRYNSGRELKLNPRMNYNRNFDFDKSRHSSNHDLDFSLEGRAKLKKDGKN